MLPAEFIKRLDSQKYIDKLSLIESLQEPSPVSIRLNRGKWQKIPLEAEKITWCSSGYYLKSRPSFTLDPLFHAGCYYPQEASSMFIEHVFRQLELAGKDIRVLDLCGAPGGKSTHLSDLVGPGSLLVANEVIRPRSLVLAETLTKWGAANALVTQNDPAAFSGLEGFFDLILVDAPCSGEGMFRTEAALREWSPANTALCSERQRRILTDAWPALKSGGYMLYSTCTFNPAENEENVAWFTGQTGSATVPVGLEGIEGICEIKLPGCTGYGLHPGKIRGDGFFISVIRKEGNPEDLHPGRRRKASSVLSGAEVSAVNEVVECSEEKIWKSGDSIFVLPCSRAEFGDLNSILRIVKAGTRVFNVKGSDLLPTHELALSKVLKKNAFPVADAGFDDALAYMKRGSLAVSVVSKGWNLLSYNDIALGFVNNLGTRLNNYFPVEWRIRMDIPDRKDFKIIIWDEERS